MAKNETPAPGDKKATLAYCGLPDSRVDSSDKTPTNKSRR